jgi:hypothetical protein
VAPRPGREREYPRAGYGRVIGIAGSMRETGTVVLLTGGAEGDGAWSGGEAVSW